MKTIVKLAVAALAVLGLGACEGRTDENIAAAAEGAASDVENLAEKAAAGAENIAADTANAVESGVDAAGNRLDRDDAAGNGAAESNSTGNSQ
jgi:hypothetical protein